VLRLMRTSCSPPCMATSSGACPLLVNQCPPLPLTFTQAPESDTPVLPADPSHAPPLQLEALQWLHAHGCPLDRRVTSGLASSCDLEGLQWALDAGAPMYERACIGPAQHGRRDVIELLRAHGCPWNDACYQAARAGHWGLVRWMRAQDPPAPWDAAEMERIAAIHRQWDVADAARAELEAHVNGGGGAG
jgi:hypothetical protein